MSKHLEFEDKSVEKAIQKACDKVHMPEEELRYKVISYGSSGIFGLVGSKTARIRVTIPESALTPNKAVRPAKEQASPSEPKKIEDGEKDAVSTDPVELGKSTLQRIINFITTDAEISVKESSDRILLNVKGGNTAALIGKHGQTLEAIQYLVAKIVNRHMEERTRIHIDIEGYLAARQVSLERLAVRLAEKVKLTGKSATVGQMNAYDRRIVHLALKSDEGVRTLSKGGGFIKKLLIFPKKNSLLKEQQSNLQ
ncbi:MAG TPA: RNA-binding cell elongation regulator Jag/EloR [Desulfobacterales bacterium]|nr:RNA-binding cell elongation regulator Jag/EloR [Desulfobacterales bacterium]